MKDKSIFTRQNQTLINLFRDAKHPDKVLCVLIDYAKKRYQSVNLRIKDIRVLNLGGE